MDFAKNLMKKFGWQEGQGLGKNNEGIAKPLKANLKFDYSGLGIDKAKEFNNHWWERVFNEAANNINVKKNQDEGVSFMVEDSEAVEISTKDYSVNKLKKLKSNQKYQNFHETSILKGFESEEISDKVNTNDLKFKQCGVLTDDELFAACGGRTAHKAARHGLNMKGKLLRIEEQEKELLAKIHNQQGETMSYNDDWKLVSNKKKRKLNLESGVNSQKDNNELKDILYTAEYSSKKKKKEKQIENELIKSMNATKVSENVDNKKETEKAKTEKNKKRKNKHKTRKQEKQNSPYREIINSSNVLKLEEESFGNTLKVEEEAFNHRTNEINSKKVKKKRKSKDIESIDEKSKNISKCAKRKFKKSLKKINSKIEKSLSIL